MKRLVLLATLCTTGCWGGFFGGGSCPVPEPLEDGTYTSSSGSVEVLGDTLTITSNDGVVHEYRIDGTADDYTYVNHCGPRPPGQKLRTFTTETDGTKHRLHMTAAPNVTFINPVVNLSGSPATRTTTTDTKIVVEFDGIRFDANVDVTWTLRRDGEDDITESIEIYLVDDQNALTIASGTCL